jgi:hypothetical protein
MSHDDPVRTVLAGLRPPAPPPEVEARVLAAAGRALRQRRAPDAWGRAWRSRPLRVAWVTALLALLAGHVLLSLRPGTAVTPRGAWTADRERLPAEVATVAELPAIALSAAAFEPGDSGAVTPAARPSGPTEEVRR